MWHVNSWNAMLIWIVGLLLFSAIIFSIYMIIKNNTTRQNGSASKALEILNQRYASGEISEEEYIKKKKLLKD